MKADTCADSRPERQKWSSNDSKACQAGVHAIIQPVQLIINFLIMQGKITNVLSPCPPSPLLSLMPGQILSMCPPEILLMIEEAAARAYTGSRRALRQKAHKDRRLAKLVAPLANEITPKMDGLRRRRTRCSASGARARGGEADACAPRARADGGALAAERLAAAIVAAEQNAADIKKWPD
jgi:hypothetical protein